MHVLHVLKQKRVVVLLFPVKFNLMHAVVDLKPYELFGMSFKLDGWATCTDWCGNRLDEGFTYYLHFQNGGLGGTFDSCCSSL